MKDKTFSTTVEVSTDFSEIAGHFWKDAPLIEDVLDDYLRNDADINEDDEYITVMLNNMKEANKYAMIAILLEGIKKVAKASDINAETVLGLLQREVLGEKKEDED